MKLVSHQAYIEHLTIINMYITLIDDHSARKELKMTYSKAVANDLLLSSVDPSCVPSALLEGVVKDMACGRTFAQMCHVTVLKLRNLGTSCVPPSLFLRAFSATPAILLEPPALMYRFLTHYS